MAATIAGWPVQPEAGTKRASVCFAGVRTGSKNRTSKSQRICFEHFARDHPASAGTGLEAKRKENYDCDTARNVRKRVRLALPHLSGPAGEGKGFLMRTLTKNSHTHL